ncbi:MAG: GFA family protein [Thiolinea sp.]
MNETIQGSCLCGKVQFRIVNDFQQFHLCHCQQCRKITGSAHASNLFTTPDKLEWTAGEELLKTFDHPDNNFRKVFCSECGSGLPYQSRRIPMLIVPAGSLDGTPNLEPMDHVFWHERSDWYDSVTDKPHFDGFPPKKA